MEVLQWQKLENEMQRQYPQEKIAVHWQHHNGRTGQQQQDSLNIDTGKATNLRKTQENSNMTTLHRGRDGEVFCV